MRFNCDECGEWRYGNWQNAPIGNKFVCLHCQRRQADMKAKIVTLTIPAKEAKP